MPAINITFNQAETVMAERVGLPGMPSASTIPNAKSALADFLGRLDIAWTAEVGLTLRAGFDDLLKAHLQELRESGSSVGHVRNRVWLLRFWAYLITVLDHEDAIATSTPAPITLALRSLFADGSRKRTPTAKAAKIHPDALKRWMGGGIPGRDQVTALARLEAVCHKDPGYLTGLLPIRRPSRRAMKAARGLSKIEYRGRSKRLSGDEYLLKREDMYKIEHLRNQWLDLIRDKVQGSAPAKPSSAVWTTEMVNKLYDAPAKSLENSWRLRRLKDGEPERWFDCVDGHRIPSAARKLSQVRMLLGWAQKPTAEGGAGLVNDQLTLALCADHQLLRRFSAWRIARNGFPTTTDTDFLSCMKTFLSPHAYLPRIPEIGATVGIADPVAWRTHCANARSTILQLLSSLTKVAVEDSRDPVESLSGILQLELPIQALVRGARQLERNKDAYPGLLEKYWARDLVLLTLPMSNPLRAENLSGLTYRADNTGMVRKTQDGGWHIFIDKNEMKNINGAAKDKDYDQPIDPNVWPYLEQYLTTYRPQFNNPSDYLFAPSATRSKKSYWPSDNLSDKFSEILRQYVPECPEGCGIHAVRYIVATHIVVTTGDYVLAAHMLHDDEQTTQERYAHLLKQFYERKRLATVTPMLAGLSHRAALPAISLVAEAA